MASKLTRVRELFETAGIDALLVMRPENRAYMSGFTGSSAYLLVTAEEAYLLTDFRYVEQAKEQAPDFTTVEHGMPFHDTLNELLNKAGIKRVGFEKDFLTYAMFEGLSQRVTVELVPVSGLVEKLRMVKDETEIAYMQQAADIAEEAFQTILPRIAVGKSELEIAFDLEMTMRKLGAERMAFPIISASGPRSSLPHGAPTQRVLEKGDFLTLDFGAVYKGYCNDMTRTVVLGEPNEKQLEVYNLVLKAQLAAQEAIKPGMKGMEIDKVARDIITEGGYGPNFGHGLGHGVGRQVHEGPGAGSRSEQVLEANMIITVEPGIYIAEWGGVRIEDMVLVTEQGYKNFNRSSKELIIL